MLAIWHMSDRPTVTAATVANYDAMLIKGHLLYLLTYLPTYLLTLILTLSTLISPRLISNWHTKSPTDIISKLLNIICVQKHF